MDSLRAEAVRLAMQARVATTSVENEASLRHELEKELERSSQALALPWAPCQLDRTLRSPGDGVPARFVDVAHGALVIEYEPPGSFAGREGAQLKQAREQAVDYAKLISHQEGRERVDYVLTVWDGSHICFGRFEGESVEWERLTVFDVNAAERLLTHLREDGVPLVHPQLLVAMVGPESDFGKELVPRLFRAIRTAIGPKRGKTSKTLLLYTEWRRLFGQVAGVQSDRLRELLRVQEVAHQEEYREGPGEYLFALNTYIALVAKVVAALALPGASEDLRDREVPIADRMAALESGRLFAEAGVSNMLNGDFFSWYRDDANWGAFAPIVEQLVGRLAAVNFDVSRKSEESTRDLFKGMYQSFVPKDMRHSFGEYYTPDWLAEHVLDTVEWKCEESLLDPTCGSGTFLLEALRRRLRQPELAKAPVQALVGGLYGIDLNPLAVLAARASVVVFLAARLTRDAPISLPIYLADAINSAVSVGSTYTHQLQTEHGLVTFCVPERVVRSGGFFAMFSRIRELVEAGVGIEESVAGVRQEFALDDLSETDTGHLRDIIGALGGLHRSGWNGIWCSILAERFAAGAMPASDVVCGNPPWVKWSHLPPDYAALITPRCRALGVFSDASWVGGIEADIATVITYEVIDKWLRPGGRLAFLITGTVFSTESSQGFRRFRLPDGSWTVRVEAVEDFEKVAPFEGVSNHPTLLRIRRDGETEFPVRYRVWQPPMVGGRIVQRTFASSDEFRRKSSCVDLYGAPVPGTDGGPWLKGSLAEQRLWAHIFDASNNDGYRARKGVTTDLNGVFFVMASPAGPRDCCRIQNTPEVGRKEGVARVRASVEARHVFPLVRGEGVTPFRARVDEKYRILVPQSGMHGDADLPRTSPKVYRYLARFRGHLEQRSSYRRYQKGGPFWSLWSTGAYTFARHKVLWREMPGKRFGAAYIGEWRDPVLGLRPVVPDHKLYFVPFDEMNDAAYLAAMLNAPFVARAVTSYGAKLSLGVSVVRYLRIPKYDSRSRAHVQLARLCIEVSKRGEGALAREEFMLDELAMEVLQVPGEVVRAAQAG